MTEFASEERDVLKRLKAKGYSPTQIFDIGASNGYWSWVIAQVFPETKFFLFEPLAEISKEYIDILARWRKEYDWQIFPLAVGEESGVIDFYMQKNPFNSTGLPPGNKRKYTLLRLPKIRLDDFLDEHKLETPSFIKMDTQGCELEILKGLGDKLYEVELLLLETWLSRGYGPMTPLINELADFLACYGLYMYEKAGQHRFENGDLISQDFFFVNKNCKVLTKCFYF